MARRGPILNASVERLEVARPRVHGDRYPEIAAEIQAAFQSPARGQTDIATATVRARAAINPLLPTS